MLALQIYNSTRAYIIKILGFFILKILAQTNADNIMAIGIKLLIYEASQNIRRRVPTKEHLFQQHNGKTPAQIQNR